MDIGLVIKYIFKLGKIMFLFNFEGLMNLDIIIKFLEFIYGWDEGWLIIMFLERSFGLNKIVLGIGFIIVILVVDFILFLI